MKVRLLPLLPRTRARTRRSDRGFTLIEVLIALVLGAMVAGIVVAGLITALNIARSTTDQVGDSNDAGLISAFLVRDAQSAGGIDPTTALPDSTLGVSTDPSDGDAIACSPSPAVVKVRFSWIDRTSMVAQNKVVVTYSLVNEQLTRRTCSTNSPSVDVMLGSKVTSAVATCKPVTSFCTGHPTSVSLALAGKGTRAPLNYTLTASLRSAASLMTILRPTELLPGGRSVPYASTVASTIGASAQTTWTATGLPAGLSIDPLSGMVWGTPNPTGTFPVTATVTLKVTDTLYATVTTREYPIIIHAPPVVVNDTYTPLEDTLFNLAAPGVLASDSHLEGATFTAILTSGVAHGTLVLNANGSFTYTPEPNWSGPDSFKYKANDGSLDSAVATVTLNVGSVNDPPVNQVPVTQETNRDTPEVFSNASNLISISDIDAGGGTVQVRLTATNGTVTLPNATGLASSTGSGTTTMTITGTIANINLSLVNATFTTTTNTTGTLTVVTSDLGNTGGAPATDTDAVTINVNSLGIFTAKQNIGPVGVSGTDSTYSSPTYTVKGSGRDIWDDADGFQFLYRPMTGDSSVTAKVVSETVTYTSGNQSPSCYKDASHLQPCPSVAKAGVMFRNDLTGVGAINAAVGVSQGNGSKFNYRSTVGALTGSASPGDSLSVPYWVRLTREGTQITAEISPNGTTWTQRGVTQTMPFGTTIYVGLAVSAVNQLDGDDPTKKLNTATFDNVSISTPPKGFGDSYSVVQYTTLTVPTVTGVLANDSDPESNSLTANLVSGPAHGTLSLSGNGSFVYTPSSSYSGPDSFTYSANDGIFDSTPATVAITVRPGPPPNTAPSFLKGANQSIRASLGAQTVLAWATTINPNVAAGEASQLVDFVVTNDNPALFSVQPALSANGTLTYAPAAAVGGVAAIGTTTVSVTIHDNGGTTNGGIDTSATPQTFTITIVAPPVLTTSSTTLAYSENAPPTVIDPAILITDADSNNLTSATVTLAIGYSNGQDVLAFTNQNGITGAWNPATGVLTLSGTASVVNYQSALRSVTYNNSSDSPNTTRRTVTFVGTDGLVNSNTVNRTITLTAVNDAPVNSVPASQTIALNTARVFSSANGNLVSISDIDAGSSSVQVQLVSTNGTSTLSGTTGLVFKSGDSGTAEADMTFTGTVSDINTAVAGLSFTPAASFTGAASLQINTNDLGSTGTGGSLIDSDTVSIAVAFPPVLTATGSSLAYTENATPLLDAGITATDADSANLTSATVDMTTNYVNGQDILGFTNKLGITGAWNAAAGTLVLSGTTTAANYQTALRSITYTNTSDVPSTAIRTVAFVANDGVLDSNPTSRTITVTAVNDAPVIAASGTSMAYTENNTTVLDSGITATDVDSANLSSATVTMTTAYVEGQDTLAFTTQNGISGTWTASTGILALTGSSTVANYQAALRSITYNNNSHSPTMTTRTVTFSINDGSLASSPASRTITLTAVNDAPINSVPGGQTTARNATEVFSTGNGSLISISDIDAAASAVRVQLISTSGTTTLSGIGGLSFTVGDGTADATMTFTGNITNVNLALAGLGFIPTANFTGTANLQIITNDQGNTGTGGALSDTDSIAIIVDTTPVVTATVATLPYLENAAATVVDSGITVTDADGGNLSSATVTMTTAFASGEDTLAFVTQNGITGVWNSGTGVLALSGSATVANYQLALRSIRYSNTSNDPDTTVRTVTFVANDGLLNSNTASRTITVSAVNDAPVVTATASSMAYSENNTTVLDPGITVTDVDSANLSSVTVDMTTNYQTAQDTLSFTTQNGISATWTTSTGVLVLSGSATVADYQTALRSITYNNNSHAPNTTLRTVTFVANDGFANSTAASRTITITAVNDGPVNSVPGSQTMPRNTVKTFSSANGNLISISDVDASTVQVQLTGTLGTITLSSASGLAFTVGDGTADATMTFTGPIATVNLRLNGLKFNASNVAGSANLRIITNDQGSTGGGNLIDTDNVAITLT